MPLINNNEDFCHLVGRHCLCFLLCINCVGLFFFFVSEVWGLQQNKTTPQSAGCQ